MRTLLSSALLYSLLGFAIFTNGCSKKADIAQIEKESYDKNLSIDEIISWDKWYTNNISNGPQLLINNAKEAFIEDRYFIRVPLQNSNGFIYFTKTNQLQAVFIRVNFFNATDQNIEFIDIKKSEYYVVEYKNWQPYKQSFFRKNSSPPNSQFRSNSTFWFDLGCILSFGIPKWDSYGNRVCDGIDWNAIGSWISETFQKIADGGSSGNLPPSPLDVYFPIINQNPQPITAPDPNPIWNIIYGGGYYTPPNNSEVAYNPYLNDNQTSTVEPENNNTNKNSNWVWWNDNISDPEVDYSPQPRPTFASMLSNYSRNSQGNDDMPVADLCDLVGGAIKQMFDNGSISNGCAIRVSRALNYSGVMVPEIANQTLKGSDGKNYFIVASQLYNWLVKVLGQPDIHLTASQGSPNGSKFRDMLLGMQNRGFTL